MNNSFRTALALLVTAASARARAQGQSPGPAPSKLQQLPADSLDLARKYATWFLTYQADSLFAHLPVDGQQAGSPSEISNQILAFAAQAGSETQLVEERWVRRNGKRQYWRKGVYSNASEPILLRLVILPDGALGGIGLSPASQPPPIEPEQ